MSFVDKLPRAREVLEQQTVCPGIVLVVHIAAV